MQGGETLEPLGAVVGELKPDDPVIVRVALAARKTSPVGPVRELDGAVMAEQ
jgi:hypothetical protein